MQRTIFNRQRSGRAAAAAGKRTRQPAQLVPGAAIREAAAAGTREPGTGSGLSSLPVPGAAAGSTEREGAAMTVQELTREQLIEVKQHYLTMKRDEAGQGVSYGELAEADLLITDAEIFDAYSDTEFTEGDFDP